MQAYFLNQRCVFKVYHLLAVMNIPLHSEAPNEQASDKKTLHFKHFGKILLEQYSMKLLWVLSNAKRKKQILMKTAFFTIHFYTQKLFLAF